MQILIKSPKHGCKQNSQDTKFVKIKFYDKMYTYG